MYRCPLHANRRLESEHDGASARLEIEYPFVVEVLQELHRKQNTLHHA